MYTTSTPSTPAGTHSMRVGIALHFTIYHLVRRSRQQDVPQVVKPTASARHVGVKYKKANMLTGAGEGVGADIIRP